MALSSRVRMGGGLKAANVKPSGGMNSLMSMMAAQSMLPQKESILSDAEIAKKKEMTGNIGQTVTDVKSQFGGKMPVRTKITEGNVTLEPNIRLNADERGDVASMSIMEPHFKNLTRMVNEGYLDDPSGNPIKRTMRQGIIDMGQPLLSANDERLKQIQAEFNRLKSKLPFDAGGKQLTGTEKALVFKLFNITGKDNATILGDLNFAMNMIRQRAKLALGGADAVATSGPASEATIPNASSMATQSPTSSGNRMKVINLENGKRGTIDANDFDPKKYSKA